MSITQINTFILFICFLLFLFVLYQFIRHLLVFSSELSNSLNLVKSASDKANKIQYTANLITTDYKNKFQEIKKLIPWAFILIAFKNHYEEAKENDKPKIRYCMVNTAKDIININK